MYKHASIKFKSDAARTEFWIVTGFIVAALLLNIVDILQMSIPVLVNTRPPVSGLLIASIFKHLLIFISYLLLCFYVTPAFEKPQGRASNTLFVFAFIALWFTVDVINIYFAALLAIKMLLLFLNRNKENKENALCYEAALLVACWMLLTMSLLFIPIPIKLKYFFMYEGPVAIVLYLFVVHRLLPWISLKKFKFLTYFSLMLLITILSTLVILAGSFGLWLADQGVDNLNIEIGVIGNALTQLLLIMPLAWMIYNSRNAKQEEEIKTLKTELGKSDASLNFLKSQINPHFLFNALNTLYGTALQENADRTGEGIQRLGDMMRFMLEENIKDQILLSRDIDYLENYILLQKLRVATSPNITIETKIEAYDGQLMITPMLLIPFVENAFKHGISLLNPSYLKITLQTKGDTLYFDVHNSIHIRSESDPEKGQSGIGLENVKQRLTLLYPNKHELVIHDNGKEFFIHLKLELAINN
ncbi:sensor histidine kinase [Pedobacter gandavensis]|uniref:sensor histidine kinase n=1 Tax=Pedobacter gandavensis TaxID=2679963 RepID=UPI002931C162|nr:histidine kinase [Pedobacter gandavensis]